MFSGNFSDWFKSNLQENDLMHIFNDVYERVFSKFPVRPQPRDADSLANLLAKHCTDTKFNKLVCDAFKHFDSAYAFKQYIKLVDENAFSPMPISGADNILSDVFKDTQSQAIRNFIMILKFAPADFLMQCSEKYDKLGFKTAYDAFSDFVGEEVAKINECPQKDQLRLVGYLCQHDKSICDRELLSVKFGDNFKSFTEIYDDIKLQHYRITHPDNKLQGFNLEPSLASSVRMMAILAPHWNEIKASAVLRNMQLPKVHGMRGGAMMQYTDSDIVNIMCGKYNLIGDIPSGSGQILADLVTNYKLFNQYDHSRKVAVSNFLNANRDRFNEIVKNATNNIINYAADFMESNISKELNNAVTFGADRAICNDVKAFAEKFKSATNKAPMDTFADRVTYVCNTYIPLLKQFKNRGPEKYSKYAFSSTMRQFEMSKPLQIFAVADLVEFAEPYAEAEPRIIERVVEHVKEVPVEVRVPVMTGGKKESFDEMLENIPRTRIEGGESQGESLINKLVDILTSFTGKFTSLYRQLTKNLAEVPLINCESGSEKAYGLIQQFYDIAITSNKTTQYISGVWGDKDYNKLYKIALASLINGIQKSDLKGFENVISTLQSMIQLLDATKAETDKFESLYVTSPKSAAELFTVSSNALKIENDLTKTDYIKYNDAVKRLYNSIYNNKSQNDELQQKIISDYSKSVQDREQAIISHYKSEIDVINFQFHQHVAELGGGKYDERVELEQIKNAKIAVQNRFKDAICYYNQVVDPAILQFRKKIASNALTHEQLDKIMDAWTSFKHTIVDSADFKKLMATIGKHLNAEHHSVNEYANLIECLKKLMKKGNYIKFLQVLHNQAGINVEGFKWDELEDKMYDIIALKSIAFNENDEDKLIRAIEKLPGVGAYMSVSHRHDPVGGCAVANNAIKDVNFNNDHAILAHMTCNATHAAIAVINNQVNVNGLAANTLNVAAPNGPLIAGVLVAPATNPGRVTITDIQALITGMFGNTGNAVQSDHIYAMAAIGKICMGLDGYLYDQGVRGAVAALTDKQKEINEQVINTAFKAINCIANSVIKADVNAQTEFNKFCQNTAYRMVESSDAFELQLTEAVYKALSVDLFGAIDNYLTSRYTGILSLPLHVNTLFKGGSNSSVAEAIKQSGGSWFDIGMQHVSTDSKVIADATPFYIIAFNVLNFYFSRFVKPDAAATDLQKQVRMKVHKVSYLYPLYKIFKDDQNFKFESISDTDFKLFIDVCNKIWTNNATGNLDAQLKKSISTLFNELNAAIVYGGDDIVSLIESGASKETINSTMYTKIKEQMSNLTKMVTEAITDAINPALTPEQNSEVFESILATAMKQVKEQPEPYQIAKLKKIILEKNDDKFLQDYYKFMELAVMPLLTCASSYNNLFAIFNVAEVGYNNDMIDIDLSQLFMNFPVCDHDGGKGPFKDYQDRDMITMTVSDFCRYMHSDIALFNKYKSQLFEHPVVYMWNRLLLNNAFTKFHVTGKFTLPNFWVPIDESSYPASPKLAVEHGGVVNGNKVLIPASFRLFKQIFPECTGKTLYDYYEYAINMFSQDCEQFINAFISYPGINDRTRKFIADKAKSLFSPENVRSRAIVDGFNQQNEEQFKHINFTKAGDIQQPPVVGENVVLPLIIEGGSIVEAINITSQPADEHGTSYCRLGDTPFYVQQKFAYIVTTDNNGRQRFSLNTGVQHIAKCEYTWLDWVLINIALADRVNVSLPAKFISMLQSSNEIQPYLRTSSQNPQVKGAVIYQQLPNGKYPCIVTQNILSRSIVPSHKENSEYALLSKAHVASIVGMLPYLISTLQSVKETTSNDVQSDYGRFNTKIQNLIDILKLFYADISAYVSFIPFMADATQLSATTNKPHIFAELCDLVATKSASTAEPGDFAKMEWANMWFFNNISSLQFPDFKNKDRFEWMSEFAPEIVKNSIYKQTYTQSIQTLARNAWMSLIAKTFSDGVTKEFTDAKVDSIINNVINIMCECAPEYTQEVINAVITMYKPDLRLGLTGGSYNDPLDVVPATDPSIVQYSKQIQMLNNALSSVSIDNNLTLAAPSSTVSNTTQNTGSSFGCSQFVKCNTYTSDRMNEIANVDVDDFKFDTSKVCETSITMETNYPPQYDAVMKDIKDRMNKIIDRTNYHYMQTKSNLASTLMQTVKDIFNTYRGLNIDVPAIMKHIDDRANIPAGVTVTNLNATQFAAGVATAGAVRIHANDIVAAANTQIIAPPRGSQYLTNTTEQTLRTVFTKVNAYVSIITRLGNAYISVVRDSRATTYSLYNELFKYYFVVPMVENYNYANTDGQGIVFDCQNLLTAITATLFLGGVPAARTTTQRLFKYANVIKDTALDVKDTPFAFQFDISAGVSPTVAEICAKYAAITGIQVDTTNDDTKMDSAAKLTIYFGLAYINYCENLFAMPFIRHILNNTPDWPLEALFFYKGGLTDIQQNLLADAKIIDMRDSLEHPANTLAIEKPTNAVVTKVTMARMIFNGAYLDSIKDDDYKESIKAAIQSCDNYIMFRLFAYRYTTYAANNQGQLAASDVTTWNQLLQILEDIRTYEGKNAIDNPMMKSTDATLTDIENTLAAAIPNNIAKSFNIAAATNFTITDVFKEAPNSAITSDRLRKFILVFFTQLIHHHAAGGNIDLSRGTAAAVAANDIANHVVALTSAAAANGQSVCDLFRWLIYGCGTVATATATAAGGMDISTSIVTRKNDTGAPSISYQAIADANTFWVNGANSKAINDLCKYLSPHMFNVAVNPDRNDRLERLFGGKQPVLKGGVIGTLEDMIYAYARGLASQPTTRLIYYDPAIENPSGAAKTIVLQADTASNAALAGAAVATPAISTHAIYMYNPNLLRPQLNGSRNIILESIAATARNMITPYQFNAYIVPNNPNYNIVAHGGGNNAQWVNGHREASAAAGQTLAHLNRPIKTVSIVQNGQYGARIPAIPIVNNHLDVYNTNQTYKQVIKRVYLKDLVKGLELIPTSAITTFNLFSPRKSIYNATFDAVNIAKLYKAPIAQYEYSDFDNTELRYRTAQGGNINDFAANEYINFYTGSDGKIHNNAVSFTAMHELFIACAQNQYLPRPGNNVNAPASIAANNAYIHDPKANNHKGNQVQLANYLTHHTFASMAEIDYGQLHYITVIDKFIEAISSTSNTLFNEVINNNGNRSQGFAFLKGGAHDHDGLASGFYHIENIAGITPKEVLGSAYGNNLDELANIGKQLYQAVFRQLGTRVSGGTRAENPILAMSLNYFKQTPLSISAMYEQIAFPSIVFNSSVYNSFTTQIQKVVAGIGDAFKPIMQQTNKDIATFIKKYLAYGGNNNTLTLSNFKFDGTHIPTDINASAPPAERVVQPGPVGGPANIVGIQTNAYIRPINFENFYLAEVPAAAYNNLYQMPSLNSSFMGALARYTWYDYNQFTHSKSETQTCIYKFESSESTKDTQYVRALLPTTFMQFVKYLDASTTYLYAIFELGKQASFYDVDEDTEVPYSNRAMGDTFDMQI